MFLVFRLHHSNVFSSKHSVQFIQELVLGLDDAAAENEKATVTKVAGTLDRALQLKIITASSVMPR